MNKMMMNYWRIARFEIFQERDRLMNIELLMGKARESINKVSIGDIFVVKDLFEGYEWNELPKGDKLSCIFRGAESACPVKWKSPVRWQEIIHLPAVKKSEATPPRGL